MIDHSHRHHVHTWPDTSVLGRADGRGVTLPFTERKKQRMCKINLCKGPVVILMHVMGINECNANAQVNDDSCGVGWGNRIRGQVQQESTNPNEIL